MANSSFSSNQSAADQQDAKLIFLYINTFDLNKLKAILTQMELRRSLEIVNLQDDQGYNVLHSAAYYNTFRIAEFLISFFRERLVKYLKQRHLQRFQGVNGVEL